MLPPLHLHGHGPRTLLPRRLPRRRLQPRTRPSSRGVKKAFKELSRESNRPLEELSSCRLISASNPDAILALLAGAGLSRTDIAAVVSADPLLLRASVNNISARLFALRDRIGLSTPQIVRFLLVASRALRCCDVVPRLEFFISLYGAFEKVLVLTKRNRRLLNASLERLIEPNIASFRQCGVRDTAQLCSNVPRMLTYNPEHVKEFLLRAEQLGCLPLQGCSGTQWPSFPVCPKRNLLPSLSSLRGFFFCSESQVSTAVSKAPYILGFSDENIGCKVEFLINEAAMEPQYIVERPVLLSYSLEKRLVPRHYVMKVLQEKGLLNNMSLISFLQFREETFKSKFIDCHMESVPGLADAYAAARAGIVAH